MRQSLLTYSFLILYGFASIVLISCASSADTTSSRPSNNATLLADLIKSSNPNISRLTVTANNSDPSNPKITITGFTNNVLGSPITVNINIDQDKGIITTPTSFAVTAELLISPDTVTMPLRVTFEGEAAVSYAVTTKISGAPANDWFAGNNLNSYISATFAGQGGAFSITGTTLFVTGLTNSPTGDAGMITFKKLPLGFNVVESGSITFPNPDGTGAATSIPTPNSFTITEMGNAGNSMTYRVADVTLAPLTRFTPGLHIKITEGDDSIPGRDITSTLTITEEANNVIRIEGITNKVGQNPYTLMIDELVDFFTTPGNAPITRTITGPSGEFDISPGTDGTITDAMGNDAPTLSLTNGRDNNATTYTLQVAFSGASVSDWFTTANFSGYITGATFAGVNASAIAFDGTTIAISGGSDFANEPGETALFTTALPRGFDTSTNALTSPAGDGITALTDASIGTITIFEIDNPNNNQAHPVTITLAVYISPLTGNIIASYGGLYANPSDITIKTNTITISGFTNGDNAPTGAVMVDPVPAGYTITPLLVPIRDPSGENFTNQEIGTMTVTNNRTMAKVPHQVIVRFEGVF